MWELMGLYRVFKMRVTLEPLGEFEFCARFIE